MRNADFATDSSNPWPAACRAPHGGQARMLNRRTGDAVRVQIHQEASPVKPGTGTTHAPEACAHIPGQQGLRLDAQHGVDQPVTRRDQRSRLASPSARPDSCKSDGETATAIAPCVPDRSPRFPPAAGKQWLDRYTSTQQQCAEPFGMPQFMPDMFSASTSSRACGWNPPGRLQGRHNGAHRAGVRSARSVWRVRWCRPRCWRA